MHKLVIITERLSVRQIIAERHSVRQIIATCGLLITLCMYVCMYVLRVGLKGGTGNMEMGNEEMWK